MGSAEGGNPGTSRRVPMYVNRTTGPIYRLPPEPLEHVGVPKGRMTEPYCSTTYQISPVLRIASLLHCEGCAVLSVRSGTGSSSSNRSAPDDSEKETGGAAVEITQRVWSCRNRKAGRQVVGYEHEDSALIARCARPWHTPGCKNTHQTA